MVKLAIALAWFVGLATTIRLLPPVSSPLVAAGAGLTLGGIPPAISHAPSPRSGWPRRARVFNMLFAAATPIRQRPTSLSIGPFRITAEALAAGVGLGLQAHRHRSVGAVFVLTTDSTRLVDSLVQHARVSPRFAYGALAAYQAVPRLGEDLTTLREARRLRGLRGGWIRACSWASSCARSATPTASLSRWTPRFGPGPRSRATARPRWVIVDVAIGAALAVVSIRALSLGRVLCPRHGGGPTRARKIVYVGGLLDDDNGRPTLTGGRGGRHARSAEALRPRWTRGAAEVAAVASARSDPREHPEELPAYLTRSLASEIIQIKNR